jgi:hypothetical protein
VTLPCPLSGESHLAEGTPNLCAGPRILFCPARGKETDIHQDMNLSLVGRGRRIIAAWCFARNRTDLADLDDDPGMDPRTEASARFRLDMLEEREIEPA